MASERSIVVRIRAEIGDFRKQMQEATKATEATAKSVRRAGDESAAAAKKAGKSAEEQAAAAEKARKAAQDAGNASQTAMGQLIKSADTNSESWSKAGGVLLTFGAAAVAGVGLAISKYAEFDKSMSDVQSSTHETTSNMGLLRAAAIKAGADTSFSAKDAAEGIDELAKAGVATTDILNGGLNGALSLAAAGSLAVGDAAEISATALTQFKLGGKDIPHIADLLAAGAGKAQGSVEDIGMALKQSGLVASQFGLSVDDTVGSLAAFASAGLVGSDSGTSFKEMLLKLASPSKQASGMMSELGITAYDASGKFVGITGLAGQLHDKLGTLTQAQRDSTLATIFGTDAIRGANVLYQQGADGIQNWIDKVNDSGYAAATAAIKQDNLAGDIEKVGGSLDSVFIKSGSGANDVLRGLTQRATDLVNAIGDLDPHILNTGLALVGAVGGASLLGGAFLKFVPTVLSSVSAFRSLGAEGSLIPGRLGKISKAAGIASLALLAMQVAAAAVSDTKTKSLEDYTNAILKVSEAGKNAKVSDLDSVFQGYSKFLGMDTSNVTGMADAVQRITHQDLTDWAQKAVGPLTAIFGQKGEIGHLEDSFKGLGEGLSDMVKNGGGDAAAKTFNQVADSFTKAGGSAQQALDYMPGYKDALLGVAKAAGISLDPQELLDLAVGKIPDRLAAATAAQATNAKTAEVQAQMSEAAAKALADMGISASGAVVDLDKLITSMEQAGLIQLSANEALRGYYASLDAVDASIKQNGKTLDIHTDKGRANQAALDGVAKAGLAMAEANAKNSATLPEVSKGLKTTYDDLIANYGAFGITGDAADTLARKSLGIPKGVKIDTAIQHYADTMAKLNKVSATADAINHKVVTIFFQTDASGFYDPSAGTNGHGAGSGGGNKVAPKAYANGGLLAFANGGTVQAANGLHRESMIAKGGANILWAEPETGWEAYISGKPGQESRNRAILQTIAPRLGMTAAPSKSMAGGNGAAMSRSYAGSAISGNTSSSVTFAPQIHVNGATDSGAVVQEVMGKMRFEMQKAGVRLGG